MFFRGCGNELPRGCKNNGNCSSGGCNKLSVFDWLSNIQEPNKEKSFNGVEVRFKGSRKEFYNNQKIPLQIGDVVAVQSKSGHDVGVVTIVGALAKLQMRKSLRYQTLMT